MNYIKSQCIFQIVFEYNFINMHKHFIKNYIINKYIVALIIMYMVLIM